MLDNCINNCCIATTYKLMTKMHHFTSRKKKKLFTVHVPNLKRKTVYLKYSYVCPLQKLRNRWSCSWHGTYLWLRTNQSRCHYSPWCHHFSCGLTCNLELWTFSFSNSLRIINKMHQEIQLLCKLHHHSTSWDNLHKCCKISFP